MTPAELLALAERCEAADGPDPTLGADILTALTGEPHFDSEDMVWRETEEGVENESDPTAGLDACRTLHERVLPGWGRDVDATVPSLGITVRVHTPFTTGDPLGPPNLFEADNHREELAWCAAIIRALAAKASEP